MQMGGQVHAITHVETEMKMSFERTRSVAHAHDFLEELARDKEVPERVRQNAQFLYAIFPPSAMSYRLAGLKSKQVN